MKLKKTVLFVLMMLIPVFVSLAEGPGGPGSGPNGNGTPEGNGGIPVGQTAPVGSGLLLTLVYSGLYGMKKVYYIVKKKE